MRGPELEVIVSSLDDAIEAERGGATRLEIVRDLNRGGLTPPLGLVSDILATVRIPLRVMLRERDDYVISGSRERDDLCRTGGELSALGIEGLVLGFVRGLSDRPGFLREPCFSLPPNGLSAPKERPPERSGVFGVPASGCDPGPPPRGLCAVGWGGGSGGAKPPGLIDLDTTKEVLASAPGLRATFHHAFDDLGDPIEALAPLKTCGCIDHVLTRGGARTVEGRAAWLRTVARAAWPEITIILGGGVDASVIRGLRRETSVGAFHVGRAARVPESATGRVSATKVRALRELLESEIL
jgi:copper homeostasis protein CutC